MKGLLHNRITKKGFTLAELLIVVAILAILVAVSIPIFTSKLDEAKRATDEANLRACKSVVTTALLTDEFPEASNATWNKVLNTYTACYDAENGCLVATYSCDGYGQGSEIKGFTNYTGTDPLSDWKTYADSFVAKKDSYIIVWVVPDENIYTLQWSTPA